MTDLKGRPDDPDLAPDAALATDLGDEEARRKEQLAYYGGDEDEIDSFDPTGLDDGSDPNAAPAASEETEAEDTDTEEKQDDDAEEEPAAEAEESGEEDQADAVADKGEDDGDASREAEKAQPQGIPKSRFDEVNERRKAAEKRLAELEAQQQAETQAEKEEYDFDAAEMEYQDLLLDGKTDEALAKRREIRAAEHATWTAQTQSQTLETVSQQEMAQEITNLSTEAERMFPVFNEDHEDYDHNVTNKVLTFYRGYVAGNEFDNLSDAFVAALADVVDMYGLTDRYGVNLDGSEAKPEPAPQKLAPKKDPDKKKLAEKAHQPAAKAGEGSADRGVAAPSIFDMSDTDLDKMSEEQLARMRGDFL